MGEIKWYYVVGCNGRGIKKIYSFHEDIINISEGIAYTQSQGRNCGGRVGVGLSKLWGLGIKHSL